ISNARVQLATDTANARLIEFLDTRAPSPATALVNMPRPSEYVHEVFMHMRVFHHRPDLRVDYIDADATRWPGPVLIATPIMVNQPTASARLGIHAVGAQLWRDELHRRLPGDARLVYRGVERARLVSTHLQLPFCPLLLAYGVRNNILCAPPVVGL